MSKARLYAAIEFESVFISEGQWLKNRSWIVGADGE
jgi:hypothetical protein